MPRIDPLLTAMLSNRADAVRLSDGDIAHIIKDGAHHPLTRQPLGQGQLLMLLREMASPEIGAQLGGAESVEFTYSNAEGRFIALVSSDNGTLHATVRSGGSEEPQIQPTATTVSAAANRSAANVATAGSSARAATNGGAASVGTNGSAAVAPPLRRQTPAGSVAALRIE